MMGEFSTDNFDWLGRTLFVLAIFANMVILLNLVIAIIGEKFQSVNN